MRMSFARSLQDLFSSLDPHDTGVLHEKEIQSLARRLSHNEFEVQALISHMDQNGDGEVDRAEFARFWSKEYGFGSSFVFDDDTVRVRVSFRQNTNLANAGGKNVRIEAEAESARSNLAQRLSNTPNSGGDMHRDQFILDGEGRIFANGSICIDMTEEEAL
eukprot:SAG22_NODE_45_length_24718_cov_12.462448_15_plen_161_part_00